MATVKNSAVTLGRLGGLARARRLTTAHKKMIASHGGKARAQSLLAARRIRENFDYLNAVLILQGKPSTIKSVSKYTGPLPGHYAKTR